MQGFANKSANISKSQDDHVTWNNSCSKV